MRTNLIIVITLILVVGISGVCAYAIDSFCLSMLQSLAETREYIMANEWEKARASTESIMDSLASSRSWITIIINQRMLNDIEIVTERMCVCVEMQDQLTSLSELVSLKSYLEELRSDTFITITNLL
jgi:hypothetical protein